MSATLHRSHYQVTFAVLAVSRLGVRLAAVTGGPGPGRDPGRPPHQPDHGHLGADRLPAVGVGLHADHGPGRRHGRQGADASSSPWSPSPSARCSPRWPRASALMIVGPGHPGGRRRCAAAVVRDHPRRVPERKVPGAVGAVASLTAVGAGLGSVLAGPIVDALDYHWLFWLPDDRHRSSGRSPPRVFVPESPVRTPGGSAVLPARAAVGLAGRACCWRSARAPRWGWTSAGVLGLLVAAVVLADALGLGREPVRVPADRHADDAAARGVDDQPGGAAGRRSACTRSFAFLPQLEPDPERGRLRVRRVDHRVRPDPAAVRRSRCSWPGCTPRPRPGGSAPKAVVVIGSLVVAVADGHGGLRPRRTRGSCPRQRGDGHRGRPGLRLPVQPDRGSGPARADRRRQRHERQHPHHRWLHRRGRDGHRRDGQRRSPTACPASPATPAGSPCSWS